MSSIGVEEKNDTLPDLVKYMSLATRGTIMKKKNDF